MSQDFALDEQRALIQTKKKKKKREGEKLLGESHFRPIHCKKCLGTINLIKWQFYAAVTCGMIRDHPGMLRLVGLYCALTDFCMGAERDRERMDIMREKEKCFAGQLSKSV